MLPATKKKRKASTKTKRVDAEKAAEHWARWWCACVCTRRPVRTQFQSIDFFGADVVGKDKTGAHVYVQVTTGQAEAARVRRRKLEKYPWHPSDKVFLLQLDVDDSVRPFKWFFKVHEYKQNLDIVACLDDKPVAEWTMRSWVNTDAIHDVPREWFKAWKEPTDE